MLTLAKRPRLTTVTPIFLTFGKEVKGCRKDKWQKHHPTLFRSVNISSYSCTAAVCDGVFHLHNTSVNTSLTYISDTIRPISTRFGRMY